MERVAAWVLPRRKRKHKSSDSSVEGSTNAKRGRPVDGIDSSEDDFERRGQLGKPPSERSNRSGSVDSQESPARGLTIKRSPRRSKQDAIRPSSLFSSKDANANGISSSDKRSPELKSQSHVVNDRLVSRSDETRSKANERTSKGDSSSTDGPLDGTDPVSTRADRSKIIEIIDSDDENDSKSNAANVPQAEAASATIQEKNQKASCTVETEPVRNFEPHVGSSRHNTDRGMKLCHEGVRRAELQCWLCEVELQAVEGVSCYAIYDHPFLHVPLCSLCFEGVDGVSDPDACDGCGDQVAELFLCDNPVDGMVCSRQFCHVCLRKSGVDPDHIKQSLDDWCCLVCHPPPLLKSNRLIVENLPGSNEKRTIDDLCGELSIAEDKRKECEKLLEDEALAQKRLEFRQELESHLEEHEIDTSLQHEMETWKQTLLDHDARLLDFISKLQDELETKGLDMSTCYFAEDMLGQSRPSLPETVPDWVRAADRAIEKRELDEADLPRISILAEKEYDKDFPNEDDGIEQLADWDDDNAYKRPKGNGWTNSRVRLSSSKILQARENEDRRRRTTTIKCVSDDSDRDAVKQGEDIMRSDRGVMVVRSKRRGPDIGSRERSQPLASGKRVSRTNPILSARTGKPIERGQTDRTKDAISSSRSLTSAREVNMAPTFVEPFNSAPYTSVGTGTKFVDSDFILCTTGGKALDCARKVIRTVTVSEPLARQLKSHQKEGIQFVWNNCFVDFEFEYSGNMDDPRVGGSMLAHNMGLGKTFTTISLLHTVLTHPNMASPSSKLRPLRTVLLVVPVNTIVNWCQEFHKWIQDAPPLNLFAISSQIAASDRLNSVRKWRSSGGVMVIGDALVTKISQEDDTILQPDILVLDEAHSMVQNADSKLYKALSSVQTKRRILLSGSPFQNNLIEYYRMCTFIRNDIFGSHTENQFKKLFVTPIMEGLYSDSSKLQHAMSVAKSAELQRITETCIHRKDVSFLARDLPPLTQVVLHVRQSRAQAKLYRAYDRARQCDSELRGFFKMFQALRPIHNHPYCLKMKVESTTKSDCGESKLQPKREWWENSLNNIKNIENVECGYKIVLLINILVYAQELGEKVLVFSSSLPTLDYIERALQMSDWVSKIPSLAAIPKIRSNQKIKLGGWQKQRQYLRIDGATQSSVRGDLVDKFNNDEGFGDVRAFLISSKAGGVGINLTSASRVVLLDTHFNPSVTIQTVFRAYRYGQKKRVFCYRLLTEGSIEAKVYGRSVNKSGVALRVIDKKSFNQCFSAKEVDDFQQFDNWVQCDNCEKWRMLFGESADDLPEKWYCKYNSDPRNNKCEIPERDQAWYLKNLDLSSVPTSPPKQSSIKQSEALPSEKPEDDDVILRHLLTISEETKKSSFISRHYYHDKLLRTAGDEDDVNEALRYLKEHRSTSVATMQVDKKDGEKRQIAPASKETLVSNAANQPVKIRNLSHGRSEKSNVKKEARRSVSAGKAEEGSEQKSTRQSARKDPDFIDLSDDSPQRSTHLGNSPMQQSPRIHQPKLLIHRDRWDYQSDDDDLEVV